MGAVHAHALYIHEHSAVHRLHPEPKLVALVVFVVGVAITPPGSIWAFGVHAAIALIAIALARIPARFLVARLAVVVPFLLFALLIPFIASGERVTVLGLELSRPGLWAAWGIAAKAVLGATASIVLVATTDVPSILKGLTNLRAPTVLVAIAGFMVRYLELTADELGRMRTAMAARAYDPRWLWESIPIANAAGALFVRTYERGERVHAAMLSRGFTGTMPATGGEDETPTKWMGALAPAALSLAVAVVAIVS